MPILSKKLCSWFLCLFLKIINGYILGPTWLWMNCVSVASPSMMYQICMSHVNENLWLRFGGFPPPLQVIIGLPVCIAIVSSVFKTMTNAARSYWCQTYSFSPLTPMHDGFPIIPLTENIKRKIKILSVPKGLSLEWKFLSGSLLLQKYFLYIHNYLLTI